MFHVKRQEPNREVRESRACRQASNLERLIHVKRCRPLGRRIDPATIGGRNRPS